MKIKAVTMFSAVLLMSGVLTSTASAEGVGAVNVNAKVDVTIGTQGDASSTATQASIRGNATSSAKSNVQAGATSTAGSETSTSAKAKGELNAESHRSSVASFVKSLLTIADREGGIGSQVRVVATSQQNSASTSANAIAKVENRGSIRNFFFGSDYKSLGDIRSEMATTSANIAKLKSLLAGATNDSDKAELSAQIQVLENSQVQVEAFVKAHESSFSLFGWFTKRFAK